MSSSGFNIVRPSQRSLTDIRAFNRLEPFILSGYEVDGEGKPVLDEEGHLIINDWSQAVAFGVRPLSAKELIDASAMFDGIDPFQVCQMLELATLHRSLLLLEDEVRAKILLSEDKEGKDLKNQYYENVSIDVLRFAWNFVSVTVSELTGMITDVQVVNPNAARGVMALGRSPEVAYFDLLTLIFQKGGRIVGVDDDGNPIYEAVTRSEVEFLLPHDIVSAMIVDYSDEAADENGEPTEQRRLLWRVLRAAGLIAMPSDRSTGESSGKAKVEASDESKTPDASSPPKRPAVRQKKSAS